MDDFRLRWRFVDGRLVGVGRRAPLCEERSARGRHCGRWNLGKWVARAFRYLGIPMPSTKKGGREVTFKYCLQVR